MKKDTKELMQDALGLLRDDYIEDAQTVRSKPFHKRISWKMIVAASIAVLLVAGVFAGTILNITQKPQKQEHNLEPSLQGQMYYLPNVWEQDNFKSVSFLFQNAPALLSLTDITQTKTELLSSSNNWQIIEPENIPVGQNVSVGLENLIADRYAVAYDENYCPVFYDLKQNTLVDLDTQIIGDERVSLDPLIEACFACADELYPGILDTQNNCELLTKFVNSMSRDMAEWRLDYNTLEPDVEFLSKIDGFKYDTQETLRAKFSDICLSEIYLHSLESLIDLYHLKPSWVEVMGIDGKNGKCLAIIHDVIGNGLDYVLYDFNTDISYKLPDNSQNSLIGTMWGYGDAEFRFSADGKVISVVYPDVEYLGSVVYYGYFNRYVSESYRSLASYNGEKVGVFYPEYNTAVTLPIHASSEAFISESGNVIYYKKCQSVRTNQTQIQHGSELIATVKCPDKLWYSRLYNEDKYTDQWVFATIDPKIGSTQAQIVLPGKFVRFMANESVVLMDMDGVYTAYDLKTGKDVTAEITSNTYAQSNYPYHERLIVYEENGILYKKDAFVENTTNLLAQADQYAMSKNGAFVFAYNSQTKKSLCINVASGQSIEVKLSDAFLLQLTELNDSELIISYNEYNNTLLFSISTRSKDKNELSVLAQEFENTILDRQ